MRARPRTQYTYNPTPEEDARRVCWHCAERLSLGWTGREYNCRARRRSRRCGKRRISRDFVHFGFSPKRPDGRTTRTRKTGGGATANGVHGGDDDETKSQIERQSVDRRRNGGFPTFPYKLREPADDDGDATFNTERRATRLRARTHEESDDDDKTAVVITL